MKEKKTMDDLSGKILIHADSDLEDIIPVFLKNRQKDIAAISDALEKDDFEDIRIRGHSMKGVGSGYGFDEITEIGRDLEIAAKEKDKAAATELLARLTDYMERVEVVYEEGE